MAEKKKKMQSKYRFRRMVFFALVLVIVGGIGWLAGSRLGKPQQAAEPQADHADAAQEDALPAEDAPEQEETVPVQDTLPEPEEEGAWQLILVNPWNELPEDFEVELARVDSYQVDARIVESLGRMFADAKAAGINLTLCSGYRTTEYQQTLFERKKDEYMQSGMNEQEAVAATSAWIAIPGTSEHHTGLAVDIVTPDYQTLDEGFANTSAFAWLSQNAHLYGFVLRYPANKEEITGIAYESWHYRYVGKEAAAEILQAGYCLEEYLYVKQISQPGPAEETQGTETPENTEGQRAEE